MDLDKHSRHLALEKIQEMISYLELRIRINAQLIFPIDKLDLSKTHYKHSLGPLSILESVHSTNQRSEKVIQECHNSINKLMLFRDMLPQLQRESILALFDQYLLYSLEDFQLLLEKMDQTSPLGIK